MAMAATNFTSFGSSPNRSGTVPELLFEKKGLIPAPQVLLVSHL